MSRVKDNKVDKNKIAKKAKFVFTPFSKKQLKLLTWWCDDSPFSEKDGIIVDGAIRSGKTVILSFSFINWAMDNFSGESFALCGKTIGSLRRNVIKPLKNILKSRGYKVEEHRADNEITIKFRDVENEFFLFGGKDESSQDLIQGITLAGIFLDEVVLMPESFVNQAVARCSVQNSKIWMTCNPESPTHYIKKNWIDEIKHKNFIRIHFEMKDNPSLTESILKRYESMYKGVFYDRFVRGLWVLASGLIFKYFAENEKPYLFNLDTELNTMKKEKRYFTKLVMGIDFGGNGSKTTMVLMGYLDGYKGFRVLEERGLPITENIDAKKICDSFIEFYKMCIDKYRRIDFVFPDSASPTLINSLISVAKEKNLPYTNIKGCRKNEISERPKTIDLLFNTGRLKINESCINVINSLKNLRWDEKDESIPEDKNIDNCNDWYDALCYTMLDFIEFIDLAY